MKAKKRGKRRPAESARAAILQVKRLSISALLQVNFTRALASCYSRLGRAQECAAALDALIEQWPDRPSAYIVLADFHSHLFPGERVLPLDLGRAECPCDALTLPDLTTDDRRIVKEHLTDFQPRARTTQPPG